MSEVQRIRDAYARRDASGKTKMYSMLQTASLLEHQQREREIIRFLKDMGCSLGDKRILDVGCGNGGTLRDFVKYGSTPESCCGIDLLPDRIAKAKRMSPNMAFQCGNAEKLPYDGDSFDIQIVFTVFSSILDGQMKKNIAHEMLRVLKSDGFIFWYDYHMNNPNNPDVRGVKRREIYALFENCSIHLKRITLAPPLLRLLSPYSWMFCYFLEKFSFLCTHYLGIIRPSHKL